MTDYIPCRAGVIHAVLDGKTFKAIGLDTTVTGIYGLSRERVRQIYETFLKCLERRSRLQAWWWVKR